MPVIRKKSNKYGLKSIASAGSYIKSPMGNQLIETNRGRMAMTTVKMTAVATTATGLSWGPLESSVSKYLISPADEEKPSFLSLATD